MWERESRGVWAVEFFVEGSCPVWGDNLIGPWRARLKRESSQLIPAVGGEKLFGEERPGLKLLSHEAADQLSPFSFCLLCTCKFGPPSVSDERCLRVVNRGPGRG